MDEKTFRIAVNGLWAGFAKANDVLRTLESIGLYVDPEIGDSDLQELCAIRDKTSETIVDMLCSQKKTDDILSAVLDFMGNSCAREHDSNQMSEEQYTELIRILKSMNVKLPWETVPAPLLGKCHDNYRRHRAITIEDKQPVVGYLWKCADYAYIIPSNECISYNKETEMLKVHAVEVYPKTIAVDMLMEDDDMVSLFEGDTVRIGDDTFVLNPMDMNVLQKLASPERKEKGLFRIKPNYEDFFIW